MLKPPPFSGMDAVHEVSEGTSFCRLTLYIDLHSGVFCEVGDHWGRTGQLGTDAATDIVLFQQIPPPPKGLYPSSC